MTSAYPIPSADAITAALTELSGWSHVAGRLEKTYQFEDFVAAFGWMSKVALVAERMNHHPEWHNVYRTVKVALQTHDVSPPQVTEADLALARAMERLAG